MSGVLCQVQPPVIFVVLMMIATHPFSAEIMIAIYLRWTIHNVPVDTFIQFSINDNFGHVLHRYVSEGN